MFLCQADKGQHLVHLGDGRGCAAQDRATLFCFSSGNDLRHPGNRQSGQSRLHKPTRVKARPADLIGKKEQRCIVAAGAQPCTQDRHQLPGQRILPQRTTEKGFL